MREEEERDGAGAVGVDVVDSSVFTATAWSSTAWPAPRHRPRDPGPQARPARHARPTPSLRRRAGSTRPTTAPWASPRWTPADAGNRWIFPELVDEGLEPWQVGQVLVVADPAAHALRRRVGALRRRGGIALGARGLQRGLGARLSPPPRAADDDPGRQREWRRGRARHRRPAHLTAAARPRRHRRHAASRRTSRPAPPRSTTSPTMTSSGAKMATRLSPADAPSSAADTKGSPGPGCRRRWRAALWPCPRGRDPR